MVLAEVAIFVRAVELGSISAAARSLRLSVASASVRLSQLEQQVGARLLNRTTRSLQPTEAGRVFYKHALEVLAAVERAETSVADISGVPSGVLKVAAPLGFGRQILAPLIADFHRQYPRVEIRLRSSDHGVDLLAEHVDIAVRTAALPDSSFVVRKLADGPRVVCAAPSYLAAHGRPQRPEDLADHNCLLLRFPGSTDFRWPFEGMDTGIPVAGRFDADDGEILTQWALQGEGVVLKPYWEVAQYIRSGALEVLLGDHKVTPLDITLIYPNRDLLASKTRVFADFLVERVKPLIEQPA